MMEIAKFKKELFEKLAKVTIKRGCGEIFEITANLFSVELDRVKLRLAEATFRD